MIKRIALASALLLTPALAAADEPAPAPAPQSEVGAKDTTAVRAHGNRIARRKDHLKPRKVQAPHEEPAPAK